MAAPFFCCALSQRLGKLNVNINLLSAVRALYRDVLLGRRLKELRYVAVENGGEFREKADLRVSVNLLRERHWTDTHLCRHLLMCEAFPLYTFLYVKHIRCFRGLLIFGAKVTLFFAILKKSLNFIPFVNYFYSAGGLLGVYCAL